MPKRATHPRLLTPRQVEQRLNINKATLSRWVAAGKIQPAITAEGVNGIRLYDADDIERIAAERAAS
jgi:DNA-binding transcriptional MerR regulator